MLICYGNSKTDHGWVAVTSLWACISGPKSRRESLKVFMESTGGETEKNIWQIYKALIMLGFVHIDMCQMLNDSFYW